MLVISMNSKRQRRPNVRLGEIGDMPAAFACVFSQNAKDDLRYEKWELNMEDLDQESERDDDSSGFTKQKAPGCLKSSSVVSSKLEASGDLQQNRENKDPNSPRSAFDFTSADEIQMGFKAKPNLNFGQVTRKSRLMKRRARGNQWNNDILTGTWSLKSRASISDGNAHCEDGVNCGAPATSKEPCMFDMDEHRCSSSPRRDAVDHWQDGVSRKFDNERATFDEDCRLYHQIRDAGAADVDSIKAWLEYQGFGRYAGVFELHEVDKETLPLLTLEDLKDMGILAVGHRRKLYTAIQQLREDEST